jgi:hypothetical protein
MVLVSLHLPKTAGASFGKSLETYFGAALLRDYGDQGINKPPFERNQSALRAGLEIAADALADIRCVHGHFLPAKYLLRSSLHAMQFITWMRDPVERLISHYNYWQRSYHPNTLPHHKKVIEEKWTLAQFCLSPQFRNIYSQYLWAFPLRCFDFIGITEHYEEDLAYFSDRFLAGKLDHYKINTAHTKTSKDVLASALRKKIEAYHQADMELYRRALALRQTRRAHGVPGSG